MKIGELFNKERMAKRMTLREIYNKTGIKIGLLSDIEHGRKEPTEEMLREIEKALNVTGLVLYFKDEHYRYCIKKMLDIVSIIDRRDELFDFIDELDKTGKINWEMVVFIEDYEALAKIIDKKYIIVDVGCSYALQHIFFNKHKRYIGIEECNKTQLRSFTENCEFIRGRFHSVYAQIYQKIKNETHVFAIANMSLLYYKNNESDVDLFNKMFERKFIK